MLVFEERGKSEYTEKNLLAKRREPVQQTQPTYVADIGGSVPCIEVTLGS